MPHYPTPLRPLLAAAILSLFPAAPAAAQQYVHSDERREQIQRLIEQQQPPDAGDEYALNAYALLPPLAESFRSVLDDASRNRQYVYGPDWYIPFEAISDKEDATPGRIRIVLDALEALEHRGLIDVLDRMAEARRAVRPAMLTPDEPRPTNWKHRDLAITRLALEARLVHALDTEDHEAALSSFRGLLAIDRILSHQLSISDRIIGSRASSAANRRLREAIIARPLSPAVVFPALEILESQLAALPPTSQILAAERIIARDSIEHDDAGYGWKIGADGYSREEVAEITDQILAAAQQLAAVPVRDRRTDPAAIEATRVLGDIASGREAEAVKLSVNTYTRLIEGLDEIALDNAATRIMIALDRYKLRHGVYPEALADLTPRELAALEGGFPMSYGLVYRRDGEAYTLYSPGYDLTDNGGTPDPDRPEIALRPEGAGFDYFFRPLPRSAPAESGPQAASPAPADAAPPRITPDEYYRAVYQLVLDHQPADVDPATNAWPLLEETIAIARDRKALAKERGEPPLLFWFQPLFEGGPSFSDEEMRLAVEGVRIYEELGIYENLAKIAATPRAVRPQSSGIFHLSLTPERESTEAARNLIRAVIARAKLKFQRGENAAAIGSLESGLGVARALTQQLTLIDRVSAGSMIQYICRTLREKTIAGELDAETLAAAAAAIERQTAWTPPYTATLVVDTLVHRTHVDESYNFPDDVPPQQVYPDIPELLPRTTVQKQIIEYMGALAVVAATAPADRDSLPRAIAARETMRRIETEAPRRSYIAATTPKDAYISLNDATVVESASARIVIALERFKLRTGGYPDSLDELAEVELPNVKAILASTFNFIYRRTETAYSLYSPGPDNIDHGGAANPEDPYPWPGPKAIGFDLVYR